MASYSIPSISTCYNLLRKYSVPHIIEHSEQVMKVSLLIYDNLKTQISEINPDLLQAGSLLHDISKYESLNSREKHDIAGARLIRSLGYRKIAEIIEEHVKLKDFNPSGKLQEKEIIFYADKRVMHNKIVSLESRVEDLLTRYGKTPENKYQILENRGLILEVEAKLNFFLKENINLLIEKFVQKF